MNSAIEILNHWGGAFLEFARAMFWQSSVLVLALLALDFGLRRRVRAAVRHGLWLVLLVKLVLPTDLALPTSPAWWWSRATAVPVIAAPVVAHHYVVTQEDVLTPDVSAADWVEAALAPAPVRPALTLAAGSLLLAGVVSLGLLGWLGWRWWQVVRASRAAVPDAELALRLGEARELTRLRSPVPVKLTRDTLSSAVCGLFRPVILLPSALAETLAPEQLRAVLLHELMHVRRGDVWVNLAQSLQQIVYWWHPLVWLANARIRRVREEAVDEAVMVALRGEADIYAPTLLAVAKFALHRPVASLGLVGILESRSALRQRIERLVTLPVPRRAGLGVLGALGIVAFSAMALPMGVAPPLPPQPAPEIATASTPSTATPAKSQPLISYILSGESGLPKLRQQTGLTADSPAADYLAAFNKLLAARGHALPTNSLWLGDQGILLARAEPADLHALGQLFRDLNGLNPSAGSRSASTNLPEPASTVAYASRNGPAAETNLFMRTFKINTNRFYIAVPKALGTNVPIAPNALSGALRDLFGRFGVDLAKPKALFFKDRLGLLFVKATGEDLTIIERVLESLNQPAVMNSAVTPDDQPRTSPGEKQWVLPKHTPSSANANAATNLVYSGPGRQNILNKLDRIHLATNSFEHMPLREVLRQLSKQSKLLDPEKQGINFLINPQADSLTGVDSATGLPPTNQVDVGATMINVHLMDMRLADVLDALVLVADRPIQYSIQDFGVVFSPKSAASETLHIRSYKVSVDDLAQGLGIAGPVDPLAGKSPTEAVLERLRVYLNLRGVNLNPPKFLSYNHRLATLAVKGTEADLDAVDKLLDSWSTPAPTPSGPTNQAVATETATNAPDVNQLMIDAMTLYESGHGDEARLKLAHVLRMDPANPAALYYWRLVHASAPAAGAGRVNNTNAPPGASSFRLSPPPGSATSPSPATITGIMSNPNFQAAIHALEQRSTVEHLAEPYVTTTSGRQENRFDAPLQLDLPAAPAPTNARPANVSRPHLLTQAYQFDRLIFSSGLQKALGLDAPVPSVEVTNALLTLFSRAGVTLAAPESIDINQQRGGLLVKATPEDQKTIAEVLGKLQVTIRPQVHIKARFIEVTGDITNPPALAHPPSGPNETAIVDGDLVRPWLHELERRPGTTNLAEPEVTTTTGRQTQMRATTMMSVVAGVNPKALSPPGMTRAEVKTNGSGFFVVTNEEFGPIFDVVPQVMADGCTINVRILAMANEFAGYDKPGHDVRVYVDDMRANDPPATTTPPAPHINDRQFRATVNLYDGQTLILTQPIDPRTGMPCEETGKKAKHLLVVMSVNIVDAAGNRVHADDELPFAHDHVPPPSLQPGTPLDDRPFNLPPAHTRP
jgi:beta-lactamase regulating signal transducer with metallopeptidase domain/Flp pilus assembly secretin CpaC